MRRSAQVHPIGKYSTMLNQDLKVDLKFEFLVGKSVDLIVSGSIGAVESVKFIRALRRVGAVVHVHLTQGAKLFTTATALEWASSKPVHEEFSGLAHHIGTRDALIIAPASTSILSKIAAGISDSPACALAQSYLGQGLPVIAIPNMHESLASGSTVKNAWKNLSECVTFIEPDKIEGKYKFPDSDKAAFQVAHTINKNKIPALICMGSTKGFFDDVRYISNYSSGALGTEIAHELFGWGFRTYVVCGACSFVPQLANSLSRIETNDELEAEAKAILSSLKDECHVIMLASVLDYVPEDRFSGKIRSSDSPLSVKLKPTSKIISKLSPATGYAKIGFKLEPAFEHGSALNIAKKYIKNYSLTSIVINSVDQVSENTHTAVAFETSKINDKNQPKLYGKKSVAKYIRNHIDEFKK